VTFLRHANFCTRRSNSARFTYSILGQIGPKAKRQITKRQRYTTVMVRVPRSFVDKTLWPEYQELRAALDDYLNDATERIIREEVYRDAGEASERAG